MYHYTECGLPYIWLKNGYFEKDTPYGKAVSIQNMDQLHKLIGVQIVTHNPTISPAELRFLRVEMDLSQADLAEMLGVNETTVRNWEKDRTKIAPPAERLIRALYREVVNGDGSLRDMIEELNKINRDQHWAERIELETCKRGWCEAA